MGTNVIYLADRVPSYRRSRPHASQPPSAAVPGDRPVPAPQPGGWAALARERAAQRRTLQPGAMQPGATHLGMALAAGGAGRTPAAPAAPALRVTCVAEDLGAGRCLGRVRISGRLIDVCAELDRLAAAEAA